MNTLPPNTLPPPLVKPLCLYISSYLHLDTSSSPKETLESSSHASLNIVKKNCFIVATKNGQSETGGGWLNSKHGENNKNIDNKLINLWAQSAYLRQRIISSIVHELYNGETKHSVDNLHNKLILYLGEEKEILVKNIIKLVNS